MPTFKYMIMLCFKQGQLVAVQVAQKGTTTLSEISDLSTYRKKIQSNRRVTQNTNMIKCFLCTIKSQILRKHSQRTDIVKHVCKLEKI